MKDSASDKTTFLSALGCFADRVPSRRGLARGTIALGLMSAVLSLLSSPFNVCAETDTPHPQSTWSSNPADGDWDTAANWVPARVPNGIAAFAIFDTSTITNVTTAFAEVHSVTFNPGASAFTLNGQFFFNDGGVVNNSGVMQTFTGFFSFAKHANAGNNLITYHITSGGGFGDNTNAGSATFINDGNMGFSGTPRSGSPASAGSSTIINNGTLRFKKADGGTATIYNNGASSAGGAAGYLRFASTGADACTVICGGGAVFGAKGSLVEFHKASAGSATFVINGGPGPGAGAVVRFTERSYGNTARVEVFDNGSLDVSPPGLLSLAIGSLEGTGLVFLGSNHLDIGGNGLSTTFSGEISDRNGVGGSLSKSGTGTLTLTNANTYTGATTLIAGSLLVNNPSGAGTGPGAVSANAGVLGGNGTIAGAVTIGTGSGSGAFLAPGASSGQIGTLTLQSSLTFNSDGTCQAELNSTTAQADEIIGNGIVIDAGAQFTLADLGGGSLPVGTTFTIISNTAATPISGIFSNLADGSAVTVGSNTYQASYEGGDGNDLTLTVVP